MLKDLKLFASRKDDFRHIRQTVAAIVDVKPLDIASHTSSVVSGGGTEERPVLPSACIPFIGEFPSFAFEVVFVLIWYALHRHISLAIAAPRSTPRFD